MKAFLAGFIVALAAVGTLLLLLWRRSSCLSKQKGHSVLAEQDHNAQTDQVEQLGKLTGELAHEIKNPLSTIKINLKLITEQLESPSLVQSGQSDQFEISQVLNRVVRKISVIQKETDRLDQILDGFLSYTVRTEPQLANTDINGLVSDMADFYYPQAFSHSITIRQLLYKEPLICMIDTDMLKQVILNLFINAQQAMPDGGDLIIRTDRQGNDVIIKISDTGIGIAPEKLPDIFSPYSSSQPKGRGLGLPAAKKMINAHNGTITVDSEQGKGSLFTISLPLKV